MTLFQIKKSVITYGSIVLRNFAIIINIIFPRIKIKNVIIGGNIYENDDEQRRQKKSY